MARNIGQTNGAFVDFWSRGRAIFEKLQNDRMSRIDLFCHKVIPVNITAFVSE